MLEQRPGSSEELPGSLIAESASLLQRLRAGSLQRSGRRQGKHHSYFIDIRRGKLSVPPGVLATKLNNISGVLNISLIKAAQN
jgi:hypothetical protein